MKVNRKNNFFKVNSTKFKLCVCASMRVFLKFLIEILIFLKVKSTKFAL